MANFELKAKTQKAKMQRMCVACRGRFNQGELLRLCFNDGILREFGGCGRSFYLCKDCVKKSNADNCKKCLNAICRSIKLGVDRENLLINFKEIVSKWQ